jgi:ABC-type multidrug transport system fused ATPase/permease subunit
VKGIAALAAVIAVLALLSFAVMLLWNSLVPELFHGPTLQYWQALGLLLLSRILFGGLRGRGWHGHWRQRMWRERWENMTPEERERLREHFQRRCGRYAPPGTEQASAPPNA